MKIAFRALAVIAIVALIATYFWLDPGRYLGGDCAGQLFSLTCFDSQRATINAFVHAQPLTVAGVYFVGYVVITALSIPGAAAMTLVGGALFGLLEATLLVSFASALGATLAFLVARFVLRGPVQARFGRRLAALNRGVAKDGSFYLFALRLVPVFPFVVINLAMALTPLRARTFYWVSQLGMLPATLVYVNAGTQLGQVRALSGVLSPGLIASFVVLGLFPLAARKGLAVYSARRALAAYQRPKRFDRNLIVIGGGSAGLVASLIAATVKARVTLVEQHRMGGDCLYTGCVPSKALLRTARFVADVTRSREFGVHTASADFDFGEIMDRIARIVETIEPHDSPTRYAAMGVDCVAGTARLVGPWTVEIDGERRLSARAIVLATGARPTIPPIDGLDRVEYLTSDNLWQLRELPGRLVVLGGGAIGCELAQAFARLGSAVVQIEMLARLLPAEDPEIAAELAERLAADGVDVRTGHTARAVRCGGDGAALVCAHAGAEVAFGFDRILVAVGRSARLDGFGLEALGIDAERTIGVDAFLQTRIPTIYACGDAIAPYQFTHTAAHEAWFATVNGLFGGFKRFKVDYSVMPWATFTDPEIAHVGLNETQAARDGVAYELTRYDIGGLDRAIVESQARGQVKVLTVPGKDTILGATIIGAHAGELIAEFVLAMKHRIGLNKLLATIHVYPTFAEANKFAAGEWKKAHAPAWAFPFLDKLHAWRRGGD